MKRYFVLVLLSIGALGSRPLFAQKGDAKAGQAVYTKSCGSCHGPQGEPKPAVAKMFQVEMRHLGAKEVQAKTDDQLRKVIGDGTGKMKPVKGLNDKQTVDTIAFLRSLAEK